ncbi:cell division protein ZapA [Guptibacillus hwajinpoensis]|uniref:Cell division protein ZapA n=1 Tax=Guptibacillus hwajinpoensis TaxID=208199 RepID=A0A0J6CZK3_9BACL|nr:cell division protein ZapA [Alkalihalobacillus macyae]KMM37454.1 cell division protein ZapA [Alkalihalobacillus macyae]
MTDSHGKIRTTVEIYGEQYTIVGDESHQHIREVSNLVDDKMSEIKGLNPYLDTKRLAVLTAVNIVNEYVMIKKELEEMKKKLREEE